MRPKHKKRRLLVLPLSRLFPNMITIGGLCCGLSAVRLGLENKFEVAVILLVAAAVIDGMDGRIARFLNSTSTFGAQLDSLSDFFCFGVAPGLLLYQWRLHELKGTGWAIVLFFAVCCALRLARFNTNLAQDNLEPWQLKFFVGVPSPAGAMLALMPIVMSFYAPGIADHPIFFAIWIAFVAALMASRIPTFAAKKVSIHHEWLLTLMIAFGIMTVLVFSEPWLMFNFGGLAYCCLIPVSYKRYKKLEALHRTSPSLDEASFHDE